jgi:PLP dependent protein
MLSSPISWVVGIPEQIDQIRQQLPTGVRLIAVSKQFPAQAIREAYTAGLRDFGENRVQEAQVKIPQLADLDGVTWHLIGSLQRNKVRPALECFDWIHSVDSIELAERISALIPQVGRRPKLLLQVKLADDPTKSGWSEAELEEALPALAGFSDLDIRGLMAIAPFGQRAEETADLFKRVKQLALKIANRAGLSGWERIRMEELSMGMSGDYPLAVQAGTTMVRLGQALFGSRPLQRRMTTDE